ADPPSRDGPFDALRGNSIQSPASPLQLRRSRRTILPRQNLQRGVYPACENGPAAVCRKDNPMKCADLLDKDHQIILRALDVLEQMAEEVKQGNSVDPPDVEFIVRFLKEFEDEHHQAKEESALFPV